MTSHQFARALASTVWGGAMTGFVAGLLFAMQEFGGSPDEFVLMALIFAGYFGVPIGAVAGLILGLPVVVAAAVMRQSFDEWRAVGAAAAAVLGTLAVLGTIGGTPPVAAGLVACVGWRAWRGLVWIFEPASDRADSVRTS